MTVCSNPSPHLLCRQRSNPKRWPRFKTPSSDLVGCANKIGWFSCCYSWGSPCSRSERTAQLFAQIRSTAGLGIIGKHMPSRRQRLGGSAKSDREPALAQEYMVVDRRDNNEVQQRRACGAMRLRERADDKRAHARSQHVSTSRANAPARETLHLRPTADTLTWDEGPLTFPSLDTPLHTRT